MVRSRRAAMRALLVCVAAVMSLLLPIALASTMHPAAPVGCPTPAAATTANTAGIPARSEVSIDAVTVLLPTHVATAHRTFVVYFPVQAHGGCFAWRTSNPALVQVQPIAATRCSETVERRNPTTGALEHVTLEGHTGVYVSAAASLPAGALQTDDGAGSGPAAPGAPHTSNRSFLRRLQAWISAHDVTKPDRFAECEIFIDRISRLEILTSTRRINVGDVEALQLAAYDSTGNVFSSLDGLPFEWANTGAPILKDISLLESGLVVSASVWELDRAQVSTNVYPVRGQTPGRVNISVALADPAHPVAARAEFLVIEPLWLKPAMARLAPGSEMKVQLLTRFREERVVHTDRGSTEESPEGASGNETVSAESAAPAAGAFTAIHRREIAMPSAQYKWSSGAEDVAFVNRDTGLVVARRTGSTRILVTDVNAPEHQRSSEVLVVEPESILLELRALSPTGTPLSSASTRRVSCDGSWFVSQHGAFELLIFLLDSQGYKIAVTPNMDFQLSFRGSSVARAGAAAGAGRGTPTSPLPSQSAQALPPGATAFVPPSSSSIYLLASALGTTTLSVSLTSIRSVAGGVEYQITQNGRPHALTQTARIVVTEPVRFAADSALEHGLVLPYVSAAVQPHYVVRAEGGSGQFQWRSSDSQIASIRALGSNSSAAVELVTAGPLPRGVRDEMATRAEVRVVDACNPENEASLPVQLSPPAAISFLPSERQEAVVGEPGLSTLQVFVVVEKADGGSYDDCSALFLLASFPLGSHVFKLSHPNATSVTSTPVFQCLTSCPVDASRNCFQLELVATKTGFAQLRVQLVDSFSVHATPLAAAATEVFSAFEPLHTAPSPLLLSVGSSATVFHHQGPLAWPRAGFEEQASRGSESLRHVVESEGIDATDRVPYESSLEYRFVQTYVTGQEDPEAARQGVLTQADLAQSSWVSRDVTAADQLRVIRTEAGSFSIQCVRSEEGLAPVRVHVLVGNTAHSLLHTALVSHSSVLVFCFPPLRLPSSVSVGIGGRKSCDVDATHPLRALVRYELEPGSAQGSAAVIDVDRESGVVHGRRLGQVFLNARVDRAELLRQLDFDPSTASQARYEHDGLQSRILVSVEFDDFRIRLSTPRLANTLLLRSHSTLAYIVGVNDEEPVDESYEHVQCQWRVEGGGAGLTIAPVLSSAASTYKHVSLPGAETDATGTNVPVASHAYGCSVRLFGQRAGSYKVSVVVSVATAHATTKSRFEHSTTVFVIEPLQLQSPSSLLLPAGAAAHIHTNMHSLLQHGAAPDAAGHSTLTFKVLSYSCAVRPTRAAAGQPTYQHVPYVSVDEQGVINVRPRTAQDADRDEGSADAVILVQSTHHSPADTSNAENDDPESLGALPLTQSLTIQVSVRPIAQLFLLPHSHSASLLCPGHNYSFALGIADPLGRRFDVYRSDATLLGRLESSVTASVEQGALLPGESSLTVQRVAPTTTSGANAADAQVLAQFVVQVGDSTSDKGVVQLGGEAHSLHSLQDFMLHFALPSHPLVSPLFLQLYVAPTSALCTEPSAVLLTMHLTLPSWSEYPSHSLQRDQLVATLASDVAGALNLTAEAAARVRVYNVDPSSGSVDLLLLPKSFGAAFHPDQWFLAYWTPAQLAGPAQRDAAPTTAAQSLDAWLSAPFSLAQSLARQATDKSHSSPLWRGALSRNIDSRAPFVTREVSIPEAEHMLYSRRGSSSALSAAATGSGGASAVSSAHSVWADERDIATWSRVMDETARDNSPMAVPTATKAGADVAAGAGAGASDSGAATTGAGKGEEAPSTGEHTRREEEEQRWRELKRRYEADRLRESAGLYPGGSSDATTALGMLLRALSVLLWSGLAVSLLLSYAYWWALVSQPMPVAGGHGVNLPADQLNMLPEHNYAVWLFQSMRDAVWRPAGGAHGLLPQAALINPQLQAQQGPNAMQQQHQALLNQQPPQHIYVQHAPVHHLQHNYGA